MSGMGTPMTRETDNQRTVREVEKIRDEGLRRALNTPPKQHKDMKKGNKRRDDRPTASNEKRD